MEIVETVDGGFQAVMTPPRGLATGFHQLDQLTHGLHPGDLVIAPGGRPMGKTAWAHDIAQHVAEQSKTVAIFSYEMNRQSVLTRLICSGARLNLLGFREGRLRLRPDERRRVSRAFTELSALPLLIDDTPLPLHGIQSRLDRLQGEPRLGLVIVDYLQLVPSSSRENRNQQVSELSRGLKLMAGGSACRFLSCRNYPVRPRHGSITDRNSVTSGTQAKSNRTRT